MITRMTYGHAVGFATFIAQIATEFVYFYPICFASIIILVCGLVVIDKIEKFKNKNMKRVFITANFKSGATYTHMCTGERINFIGMDGDDYVCKVTSGLNPEP
jgi:hypothetical protein